MSKLIIVPTPIGNLEDMTLRAIRILKEADAILAEDTRTTSVLLKHYQISNKLIAFHQHNEHRALERIVEELSAGKTYALVSDAGTPGISDPGFLLVRACVAAGIAIETLPGATAFVPALINSGFPSDSFYFEGFLPHKKGRETRLKYLSELSCTVILYESPHRLQKLMQQMQVFFGGERAVVVCRELSKMHEEIMRGTVDEIIEIIDNKQVKGEIVVVIKEK